MKKIYLVLAFLLFSMANNFAQNTHWCGTDQASQKMFETDPKLRSNFETSFFNGSLKFDDSTIYVVPVVFHVLHQYGNENISDAQIFDAMEILNEDYSATNADTSDVVLAFKQIYGSANIQFKLANLDPDGNVTNGIDRIYTYLTNNATEYSKINQWDRARYLNIWVVKTIGTAGVVGYTYYPNLTNGTNSCLDGLIIIHDVVGSIGTSNPSYSRTITHELGHWLGLMHLFGSINTPGIPEPADCNNDDLIQDTPLTTGSFVACGDTENTCDDTDDPFNLSEYTFDIIDNSQNFLNYTYCPIMFTKKQTVRMREVLLASDGERNQLITPVNSQATGVLNDPPLLAIPTPDFNATNKNPCVGTNVTFGDFSYNAPVTSRLWTFQDGTPSTSAAQNPTVFFNSQGAKSVTLTVTNAAGSNTLTIPNYVVVNNNWADYVGPYSFNFNDPLANIDWFRIENPTNNLNAFQYIPTNGLNNSGCFKLNNFRDLPIAEPCTDDYNYFNQLAGAADHLITPSFDLRFTTGATFSFDYSFGTNTTDPTEMTEYVQVYKSNDCGANWIPLTGIQGKVEGVTLAASGGFAGQNNDYAPSGNAQWQTKTVPFGTSSLDSKTRFRITFIAGAKSNNLYIDNISITGNGTAGIEDFGNSIDLIIAPNPVNAGSNLNVTYTAKDEPVTFTVRNLQGQEVMTSERKETNQLVSFNLEIDSKLPAAYYFLEVKSASATTVKKIVVMGS